MNVIALYFAKKKPLGCLVWAVLSLALAAAVLAGFLKFPYTLRTSAEIVSAISEMSGNEPSVGKFSAGLFDGNFTMLGVKIYNQTRFKNGIASAKADAEKHVMLGISRLKMKLQPADLILGRIVVSELDAEFDEVNVVRSSASEINIVNFMENFAANVRVAPEGLKKLRIAFVKNPDKRANATYGDLSSPIDTIKIAENSQLVFERENVTDIEKTAEEFAEELGNAKLQFLARAIRQYFQRR